MPFETSISPPNGRLAVLLPGLGGAVATTTIAGVLLARRGLGLPIGSFTQLGGLGVPLAALDDLHFAGWDIFDDDAFACALDANVLERRHLDPVAEELGRLRPLTAAFDPAYVRRLHGPHVKKGSKAEIVAQLRDDIRGVLRRSECTRAVCVWCGSTEVYSEPSGVHQSITAFEHGLWEDDPLITSSQLYAWACVQEGVPYANGAPNLSVDFPAVWELARARGVPLAGKDFKTGQTLMKTVIAPALRARHLGVRGWFSTNILGNRDGEVLDEPGSFKSKETSKLGSLESVLDAEKYPALYGDLFHKVRIEYFPPRGDAKEAWDAIELFGWLGYPMQLRLDFQCRDSILAAPIVLDLALLMDLAARAGLSGPQEWLSFFFKSPMAVNRRPEHDLFAQLAHLRKTLATLERSAARPAPA